MATIEGATEIPYFGWRCRKRSRPTFAGASRPHAGPKKETVADQSQGAQLQELRAAFRSTALAREVSA
jgi:hypothetical protein